ncbi:MAG: DNRLRE domain-containing protein [Candidatus Woesearchaeota archaeon]
MKIKNEIWNFGLKSGLKSDLKSVLKLVVAAIIIFIFLISMNSKGIFGLTTATVSSVPKEDVYVSSYYPTTNFNDYYQLRFGVEGDYSNIRIERSYLKFEIPALINSSNIVSAKLYVYKIGGNSVTNVQVYNCSNSWNESVVTWNTAPLYNNLVNASAVLNESGWYSFDITQLAVQTLPQRTFSLMLKSAEEDVWNKYAIVSSREIQSTSPYVEFSFNAQSPEINNVNFPTQINEGSAFNLTFSINDNGIAIDSIKVFMDNSLVSESNAYNFISHYQQSGNHTLRILVNNTLGLKDEKNYSFLINDVKNVVINEFLTNPNYDWNHDGIINSLDQWIELYNPTDYEVNISNWSLSTKTANAKIFGAIPPKSHIYFINFSSLSQDDFISLKNLAGTLVDNVSFGNYNDGNTSNNAPNPTPGFSVGRRIDGYDTDKDNFDFLQMQPTIGSENQNNLSCEITDLKAFYSENGILLKWNYSGNPENFNVYYSNNATFNFSAPNITTTQTNYTDYLANNSRQKFYAVKCVDDIGRTDSNNFVVGKIDVELKAGWNLISMPFNLTYKTLGQESVVGDPLPVVPKNSILRLYRFNASSQNFEVTVHYNNWGWYSSSNPNFNVLEPGRGYWAYANQTCNSQNCKLMLVGSKPETIKISLENGWNLIGWYSLLKPSLGEESVVGDPLPVVPKNSILRLYRFNASSQNFEVTVHYNNWGWYSSSNPNFNVLEPGRGYWAYANKSNLTINNTI